MTTCNAHNFCFNHTFIPTVTLGDPSLILSLNILRTIAAADPAAIELRLPFSDPVADSNEQQASSHRALASGVSIKSCLDTIARLHQEFPEISLLLTLYSNNAIAFGLEAFCRECKASGISALYFIDIPESMLSPEHAPFSFTEVCADNGLALILNLSENTPDSTITTILRKVPLVTLQHCHSNSPLTQRVLNLKAQCDSSCGTALTLLPLRHNTVAELKDKLSSGIDAVTSGDAIAHLIAQHCAATAADDAQLVKTISDYVNTMLNACLPA